MNTHKNDSTKTETAPLVRMTPGDALAELDRNGTIPKLPTTVPELFKTNGGVLLPPMRRAIAVNGARLGNNEYEKKAHHHTTIFELFELEPDEDGTFDMRRAKRLGNYRHVEILGPCWLHHNPEQPLAGISRRVGVMVTDSAVRVYEDTQEFMQSVEKERIEAEEARRKEYASSYSRTSGCG